MTEPRIDEAVATPWLALKDLAQAEILLRRARETLQGTRYKRAFARATAALKDAEQAYTLITIGESAVLGETDDPYVYNPSLNLY